MHASMEGEMVAAEVAAKIFVGLDSVRRVANFRPVAALGYEYLKAHQARRRMGVCSQAVHRHDASWVRRLAMPLEKYCVSVT